MPARFTRGDDLKILRVVGEEEHVNIVIIDGLATLSQKPPSLRSHPRPGTEPTIAGSNYENGTAHTTAATDNVMVITSPLSEEWVERERKKKLRGLRARDERAKWRR